LGIDLELRGLSGAVMRIALVADVYPPNRTSGAVQMRDLARELRAQGHEPTVLVPSVDLDRTPFRCDTLDGVPVWRLRAYPTKDIGYLRRTVHEFLMPYAMLSALRRSPLRTHRWDGVVWYSPTIFLGPLVRALKVASRCRSYLILRDIFPEWAVDMGLMSRGLPYRFFKTVADYQYSVADVIGIQTPANQIYFKGAASRSRFELEVLQNWLADVPCSPTRISLRDTPLADRTIFVYAGNMGVAQGIGVLIDLADRLRHRRDLGFLFVGRGSDAQRHRLDAFDRGLDNVAFFDEIEPEEIPGLYAQCHVGLVALDPRHRTHNIPGKFLSYVQAGLPVLATVNPGNDLVDIIEQEGIGRACTDSSLDRLAFQALALLEDRARDPGYAARCRSLYVRRFTPRVAAEQIVAALKR
jgi:glycosyltransferase involved in cell wall biosynthesis